MVLDDDKFCILVSSTPNFTLSEECEKEYTIRSGLKPNTDIRLSIPFSYSPDQIPNDYKNIRSDAVLVCLYREKGSEWCSGADTHLRLEIIPSYFTEIVDIRVKDGKEVLTVPYLDCLDQQLRTLKEESAKLDPTVELKTFRNVLLSYENDMMYTLNMSRRVEPYKEHALKLDQEWIDVRKRQMEKDKELLKEQPWEVVKNKKKKNVGNYIVYLPTTPPLVDTEPPKSAFSIPPIQSIYRNRFYLDDDIIDEFS